MQDATWCGKYVQAVSKSTRLEMGDARSPCSYADSSLIFIIKKENSSECMNPPSEIKRGKEEEKGESMTEARVP